MPSERIALPGWRSFDALRTMQVNPSSMRYEMKCLIEGASAADLLTQESNLKAKNGKRGTLTRLDYAGTAHTVSARLAIPDDDEMYGIALTWRPITLIFDCEWPWLGTQRTAWTTHTGSEGTVAIANSGNAPYLNTVFTVTAGNSSPVSFVQVEASADSATRIWKFSWTRTLSATQSLVIDCGARTVKVNGADAYGAGTGGAGFALAATHNQNAWFEVPAGGLSFQMTITHTGVNDPTYQYIAYDGHHI